MWFLATPDKAVDATNRAVTTEYEIKQDEYGRFYIPKICYVHETRQAYTFIGGRTFKTKKAAQNYLARLVEKNNAKEG